MVLESTAAIIDRLVATWKSGSAASRELLLDCVQQANAHAWGYADWWWKRREDTLDLEEAEREYSVEGCQRVVRGTVRLTTTGAPITFVEPEVYNTIYRGDASGGVPTVYTELALASGVLRLAVWPVPVTDPGSLTLEKVETVDTLADSAASVPRVPVDWREVLLLGAQDVLSGHAQQLQTSQIQYAKADEVLKRMLEEQGRHRRD